MSFFRSNGKSVFLRPAQRVYLLSLLLILAAGLWPFTAGPGAALYADVASRDVYALLRAERYPEVADHFRTRNRLVPMELYALARSLMQQEDIRRGALSRNGALAFQKFIEVLGAPCEATTGAGLAACLEAVPLESRRELIERLAIWRAANYANKHGLSGLAGAFLLRASLQVADPLGENIFTDRLSTCVQSGRVTEAVELAERPAAGALDGPAANLWRARAFQKAGRDDEAFATYVRAMRGTTVVWLERAIAHDVRRHFAQYFRPAALARTNATNRDIVEFAAYMPAGELRSLRQGISPTYLIQTTTAERVRADGVYLIEAGAASTLPGLAHGAYTYLSHTPEVLLEWTRRLRRAKQDGVAYGILTEFRHVLPQSSSLWQIFIELLQERSNRTAYFEELLAYESRYHAHLDIADRMVSVLIGDNASQIQWAPASYWEKARTTLPDQTGKGRFVYWLKRYYLQQRNAVGQDSLKEDFYAMAPGSFYAGAFWEDFSETGAGAARADFARDWQALSSRQDYLRWIARHGGNDAAIQYLRHRDVTRYMDPGALQLWKDFRSGVYRSPEDLQLLYRLGERSLGANFFDHYYDGRVSRREKLAREAYLGYQAGWLHMSVYYTRQFVRELDVPEDPFSMPEGLLKVLYPRPYYGHVKRYSDEYGISSDMVYALMRQESMFREQAVSRSGARGLMQIMPRTGSWLAGKMNISNPNLMDPETNIHMGTKFFADLIRSQGDFRWASIAYNGGPGNLRKWKSNYYKDDFYFFLENLPKEESRNYCRVTFQNYMHYKTTYLMYPE